VEFIEHAFNKLATNEVQFHELEMNAENRIGDGSKKK